MEVSAGMGVRKPTQKPKGSILCWAGVIGNGSVAIFIVAVIVGAAVGLSFPPSRESVVFDRVVAACLFTSFLSWLLSAAVYKLRRERVDSDALGISLGLLLLVPVGLFLLWVTLTRVLSG
jgi:hypothetical protein